MHEVFIAVESCCLCTACLCSLAFTCGMSVMHHSVQAMSDWCREVTAAGELVVEVWDLGGTRGAKQLKKLADNPSEVIRNSRFLGRAEIPLVDTLTSTQRGQHISLSCVFSTVVGLLQVLSHTDLKCKCSLSALLRG